ncbi:Histone deacetylase, partial [Caligus rogercresseyi]
MGDYYCEWDSTFSECPDRFHSILLRLEDLDILNRCVDMKPMRAKEPDVTRFHDYELLEELKKIAKISDVEELKKMSE